MTTFTEATVGHAALGWLTAHGLDTPNAACADYRQVILAH